MNNPKYNSGEYVAKGGCFCPVCGSDDIEGESIDIFGNTASQDVFCHNCESSWVDFYRLDGYIELKTPEKKMKKDPKEILMDKAAEQNWTTETCLELLCDFIAEKRDNEENWNAEEKDVMEDFTEFLGKRALQETEEYEDYKKEVFGE